MRHMNRNLKLAILGALRRQNVIELDLGDELPKSEYEYNRCCGDSRCWSCSVSTRRRPTCCLRTPPRSST